MAHWFGVHTVDNGGIHMAAQRVANAGLKAIQIFTAIPTYYGEKVTIRPERATRFRETVKSSGLSPDHVMVHAAYVLNTATTDTAKWERARNGLAKELERSTAVGARAVCFHPGAAGDDPAGAGERVAAAITYALEQVETPTRILVENTAGAGSTFGRSAAEVNAILRHVPKKLRHRTGYGLDTCHLFASGYDITESEARFRAILDEFEEATGEAPGFFHLNDSEGDLGTNRDRHALIGDGKIGTEPFRWLLADPRSQEVPLILETPELNVDVAEDDPSPDPYDVQMAALLHELAGGR